jgi:hypothetical protein
MFWSQQKSSTVELKKKNLFIAEFDNISVLNWGGSKNEDLGKQLKFLVKGLNLPSINIPFERLHGNQYVHYYHVGEVNWEPITITFVDILPNKNAEDTLPDWRKFFFSYLKDNLITRENRTGMLDLATFCKTITIKSYSNYANDDTIPQLQISNEGSNLFDLKNSTDYISKKDKQGNDVLIAEFKNSSDNRNLNSHIFKIESPKITKIDFGSLNYNSDEANEISVTFLPEWCSYTTEKEMEQAEEAIRQATSAVNQTRNN